MLYELISWNLDFKTRDEGKDEMRKILYNPLEFTSKGKEVFRIYFPETIEFADRINKGYVKTKKQGRKHGEQISTLANLLTTLEAKFMLVRLVPFIKKRFPNMPILTIHDSILVPEGEEKKVHKAMSIFALKSLKIRPIIK